MSRTRKALLLICSLAAFLGAVVATLAEIQRRDYELRGYVNATETLDLPYRIPRLGVNADLTQYTPEELATHLDRMQSAGITRVRQSFFWDRIQPTAGNFVWDDYDVVVQAVAEHPELELVAVLLHPPEWARQPETTATAPPTDVSEFASFAAEVAARYGDSIEVYQVWDEPNIALGWGNEPPNATYYASLLHAAYNTIHDADATAQVLTAALAPTVETGPQNYNELQYLRELYTLGLQDFSDGIAAKAYGFDASPADRTTDVQTLNFSRLVLIRELMVAHTDGTTPLWVTNWGWNSLPVDWNGEPSIWGQVDPEQRVAFTLNALERADREWPWLSAMILENWQPDAPEDDARWGFALIDPGGQPTELWQALVERQNTRPVAATNGLYPARNPYARYSGIWSFSDFGADIGWVEDSMLEFTFSGSEVTLVTRQGDFLAYFYPTVDSKLPNALPVDTSGNAFLALKSDDGTPVISQELIAHNLEPGPHTLRVVADELVPDEIQHRWPLVGFAVSSGDLAAPFDRQIAIGWLATAITATALAYSLWLNSSRLLTLLTGGLIRYVNQSMQLVIGVIASAALMGGMWLTWESGPPTLLRRDPIPLLLSILTSGLIYINDYGIIVTMAAAIVLFVVILNRLEMGLALTIFWAPFFLFPVELYQFAFPVAEIILLLTTAAWGLRLLMGTGLYLREQPTALRLRNPTGMMHPLDWCVFLWVVLGFLSLLWTRRLDVASTELRTLIVEPALFYLILRTIQLNAQQTRLLVYTLIAAAVTVSAVGLVMWLQGTAVITAEGNARRLASVYGSPNNVGLILGRTIPFMIAFLLLHKTSATCQYIFGACLAVVLPALLLTQSAGALFVGVPVSILVLILLIYRRRFLLPTAVLAVILMLGFAAVSQSERFSRTTDFSQGTNFYRLRVWESAFQLLADRPITGAGMDQFLYEFRDAYMMPDAWQEPDLSHPHNAILDWWVRLGITGVVLFLAYQYFFWRDGLLWYRSLSRDHLLYPVLVGVLGSMANLLAHGLVDNSVYVNDLAVVFVLLLGIVANQNVSAIDAEVEIML